MNEREIFSMRDTNLLYKTVKICFVCCYKFLYSLIKTLFSLGDSNLYVSFKCVVCLGDAFLKKNNLGSIWYCYLNNSFHYLNVIIRISTTLKQRC